MLSVPEKTSAASPPVFSPFQSLCALLPEYSVAALAFLLPISAFLSNAAIVVGVAGLVLRAAARRRFALRAPGVSSLFLLLGVAGALSMVNSVNGWASLRGLLKLAKAFGVFLLASEGIRTKGHLRRFLTALLIGAAIASADGLLQWVVGFDPLYRIPIGFPLAGLPRISGPYRHADDFGVFLAFAIPVSVAMCRLGGAWRLRRLGGLAFVLLAVSLGLTFSRWALLGVAVALLTLIFAWKAWGWLVGVIGVGCAILLFLPAPIKAWVHQQPNVWAVFVESNAPQQSRPQIWRAARSMIAAHPWVGVGVNTFVLSYPRYRAPGDRFGEHPPYAHNDYLHMLAEIGIVGFTAFLLLLGAACRQLLRVVRTLKDSVGGVALGVGCGLLAFLINGIVESALYYARLAPVFWLGFGVLFCVPFPEAD